MPRRIAPALIVTVVAASLLAGCTAGSTGVSAPATLGEGTPQGRRATPAAAAVSKVSPIARRSHRRHHDHTHGVEPRLRSTGSRSAAQDATDVTVVSDSTVTAIVPALGRLPAVERRRRRLRRVEGGHRLRRHPSYTWKVSSGVDREMQYAFAHWNASTYNASYLDFNSVGGDCQNFVSQALDARGLAQNDSWHYNSSGHSETWGYAPAFDNYLKANPVARLHPAHGRPAFSSCPSAISRTSTGTTTTFPTTS